MRSDINDGYTWSSAINLHNGTEWRFRYRPIMRDEERHARETLFVHSGKGQGEARHHAAIWLAGHIVDSSEQYCEIEIIEDLWNHKDKSRFHELRNILFGRKGPQPEGMNWEKWSKLNLKQGTHLFLTNRKYATRNCNNCKKWWYDEETGEVAKAMGKPLLRIIDTPTLCQTEAGCPKGTPEDQKSWHAINRRAFLHWIEAKSVSQFPDDPIVRRNAASIQSVYKEIENERRRRSNQRSVGTSSR